MSKPQFAAVVLAVALAAACTTPHVERASERAMFGEEYFAPARLEALLAAFAHDSMRGREAGTEGARMAARFLAAELERMGVQPAGDDGTYLQSIPLVSRSASLTSTVRMGDQLLVPGRDFLPARPAMIPLEPRPLETIVAGRLGRSQSTWLRGADVRGKAVVLLPPAAATLQMRRLHPSVPGSRSPVSEASAIVYVLPEPIDDAQRQAFGAGSIEMSFASQPRARAGAPTIFLSPAAAERLFGKSLNDLQNGETGATLTIDVGVHEQPRITWNVIAVIPGSDPALRGQYVAIGAHLDHIGTGRAVDAAAAPGRASRPDSIFNGADDDGSGSVAMLEIARSLRALEPRRSILLVWHTAEELGLYGSEYFTDHPTVPRDSIVAQLNLDMIGRGMTGDVPAGGPRYLQLIGSRRLSTELGDIIEAVNGERASPFVLDYELDAPGHPEQIYCRSDHYSYARFGIPVTFFTTGNHVDYHFVTDEPQHIDYRKLADVSRFVHDVARRLADRDARPRVDGPKPDPYGECVQ